ncbi:MAG: formylglycine-generating enzyme family protein [Luteolibacter sp.]
MKHPLASTLALALAIGISSSAMATVTIDWVTVGNPGNLAQSSDNRNHSFSGGDGFGKVDYTYQIGQNMVTNTQYAAFLNAAAKSDPYGLYNTQMNDSTHGGITRSGSDGSYTYTVKAGMGNKPVVFVSWFDAARMANWMHNGQGSGSTETGAYTLNGATSGIITMNVGASVWIPTEDEWFKAAYYNGDTGMYSLFATGADTISSAQANYWPDGPGTLTDVGAYELASFYGTYDQAGNAWEWNDAVISGSSRGLRGGSWNNSVFSLRSSDRYDLDPSDEGSSWGSVSLVSLNRALWS